MVEQVHSELIASHDHIKITTKLEKNKHGEPSEDQWNGTDITKDRKKK